MKVKEFLKKYIWIILICLICITVWLFYGMGNKDDVIVVDEKEIMVVESEVNEEKIEKEVETMIKVHIVGMVVNPGVYELKENSRVIDAINIAGGSLVDADLENINLVEKISDGVQIRIPNKKEKVFNDKAIVSSVVQNPVSVVTSTEVLEVQESSKLVNINIASKSELDTLPGIGPSTAEKIIKHREENGFFLTKEDIMNVSGIGKSKFENIKDLIEVK